MSSLYTGTLLNSSILDASSSLPSTITYSAYLMPSGSAFSVTSGTLLTQGTYGLEAQVTPNNTSYAPELLEEPFTVQNMNVFVANSVGTTTSLYNNGTVETSP